MGPRKPAVIKFDKKQLHNLASDSDSGVFKENYKYHIALHPAQFGDFGGSIKNELYKNVARYDSTFKGIMLGFENITVLSPLGVIGPGNIFVHIDVQADFFIFRPQIGMKLQGSVTRVTTDHVGCLVYKTFNVALHRQDDEEDWSDISVNDEVTLIVNYVDLKGRLPYITGHIKEKLENNDLIEEED